MNDSGYVRFHRSIWSHPSFPNEPLTQREAWNWLICAAAWKPTRVRAGEFVADLERGEVLGAVRFLAAEWQWSKGKVERYLERLKNDDMIGTRTGTGITVITVRNYDEYQGDGGDGGTSVVQEPGRERDADGDNRKETNTEKKEGKDSMSPPQPDLLAGVAPVPAKKPREKTGKHKLPPDFPLTDAMRGYARKAGWPDDFIDTQFLKWKTHHTGAGTRWVRWDLSWHTWVDNGYDFKRLKGGQANRADSAIQGMLGAMTEEDFHG